MEAIRKKSGVTDNAVVSDTFEANVISKISISPETTETENSADSADTVEAGAPGQPRAAAGKIKLIYAKDAAAKNDAAATTVAGGMAAAVSAVSAAGARGAEAAAGARGAEAAAGARGAEAAAETAGGDDAETRAILQKLSDKLRHNFGSTLGGATKKQLYNAVALTVRDEIMEKWIISKEAFENSNKKQLYYLSLEFMIGRTLNNNIINLMKTRAYQDAINSIGLSLDEIAEQENDAGLGNGGLGRLAACYMDSLSTLKTHATGCGILYEYGLFRQKIMDGYQIELPDPWLEDGNIWEVRYPDEQYEVHFGGDIWEEWENGVIRLVHENYETVIATPHDIPVLGYDSQVVNRLRLWSARSPKHFDMGLFNSGDYHSASREKNLAEALSKVLYPEDNHYTGKTLRLRQQYFFVSATMQWIIRDYKKLRGPNFFRLPEFIAIHINDTHPALAIPELMRILIDEEKMNWNDAWEIAGGVFSYTNHTIMSEALECWPITFFQQNLPRIYSIINEINETYCRMLWNEYPGEWSRIADMAVIANSEVRMANLCFVICRKVNGVSALHTDILKNIVFRNYFLNTPQKFINVTNGVTHRRWLLHANPGLSGLISDAIGDAWIREPERLSDLSRFASDAAFAAGFMNVRRKNKERLIDYIYATTGELLDPGSIFDVQVKRLHEYKRQLLNIIHILYLYKKIKEEPEAQVHPRTFIFAAKASPGYHRAKLIIKLITSVAEHIANDPDPAVREKLKVVFIENYGVSIAEKIIPAADVSEQISTAGKEASGTGNMKLMLNGAVTIGTFDGANIEIRNLVGDDNIYIFGLRADEVQRLYTEGEYDSRLLYNTDRELAEAVNMIMDGTLQPDKPRIFNDIFNSLLYNVTGLSDEYLIFEDFRAYAGAQRALEKDYAHKARWSRKAIRNVAAAGYFSSDRAINEYCKYIWRMS